MQRQTARLRQTFVRSGALVDEVAQSLSAADFARPARVRGWDVRLLTAHLLWRLTSMAFQLDHPSASRPVTLEQYAAHSLATTARRLEQARATADHDTGHALAAQLHSVIADLSVLLSDEDLPPVVDTGVGRLNLLDFLRIYLIDVVVHLDDVRDALGPGAGPRREAPAARVGRDNDPEAVAEVVRTLAEILAARAPGQSVEVRIPPFAAVQIGDPEAASRAGSEFVEPAPTHTRGTPPAVVETDPLTFMRLGLGRMTWADALGRRLVAASGLRTDLSPQLPLIG